MSLFKKTEDKNTDSLQPQNTTSESKTLILLRSKCPHCGHWVSGTISKNLLDRFASTPTFFPEEERRKENKTRQEKFGKFLGTIINSANGLVEDTIELPVSFLYGIANAIGGISTLEFCPYCKQEINIIGMDKGDKDYSAERDIVSSSIRNTPIPYSSLVSLSHFYNEKYEPELSKLFKEEYAAMIENFSQVPPHFRRFIMFVDGEVKHLSADCVTLPFSTIPNSIHFHKGLWPQKDALYVLHPYKPDLYIPYDSLDVALFDEEMSEFLDLMSKLGAKSVRFERYRDHSLSEKKTVSIKETAEVSDLETSAGGSIETHQKDDAFQKIVDTYRGVKEYELSSDVPPYIPEQTVWLPHRQTWNNEIRDRLEGRSRKIDIEVGFQQNELVSQNEKDKLELYIADLDISAKYESEREEKHVLRKMHSLKWRVIVEFYPLSEYKKKKSGIWPFTS